MSLEHISNAIAAGNAKTGIVITAYGFLGDVDGTVVVDRVNRIVKWRQDTETGNRGPQLAYLWDKSMIPLADIQPGQNVEIYLGYHPESNEFSVLGQTTPGLGATGGQTLAEQKANAAQFPQATLITDLRVVPLDGWIEAKVELGHYTRPSTGVPYKFQDNTRNEASGNTLTSLQAALTSGQHRIAWLFLDKELGKLRVVAGTAKTALDTLPAKAEFKDSEYQAISRPNSACKYLTPVYLYYGQTTLADTDVIYEWDMRFDTPIESNDASSGGSLVTANGNRLLSANGNPLKAA